MGICWVRRSIDHLAAMTRLASMKKRIDAATASGLRRAKAFLSAAIFQSPKYMSRATANRATAARRMIDHGGVRALRGCVKQRFL